MGQRHAYLIIAYAQPKMLGRLIEALDDPRNDIYVHIDKKAAFDGTQFKTLHSSLVFIDAIDARWGDVSLVEVELKLIETALQRGTYTYLHLLSDSDYPIKTQDYIHAECQRLAGREFVGFSKPKANELETKMHSFHLFPRDFRNKHTWHHVLRKAWLIGQITIGYRRHQYLRFCKGPQWWSITSSFASYVILQKETILQTYHHTFCPDEVFLQTLCQDKCIVNDDDEFVSCRRFIKWENGAILPIQESDISIMLTSPCWFARKFSESQIELLSELTIHKGSLC